jgi:hypothetical protein
VPGGSAAMQAAALVQPGWRRPVTVSFGTRRGDASVGRLLGTSLGSLVAPRSRRIATPRFRRSSSAVSPGLATRLNAGRLADQQAIMSARRRTAASPRLRLASRRRGDGMLGGSVRGAHGSPVHGGTGPGLRRSVRPSSPRFRTRPLAGSGPRRGAKRPRFGYGRHSVLAFLARRRGGKWLASRRVGTRSRVWLIGRRTGGAR